MKYDSKTTSIILIEVENRFERVETVETRLKLKIRVECAAAWHVAVLEWATIVQRCRADWLSSWDFVRSASG